MGSSSSNKKETGRRRRMLRVLLGIGFWMQGLRCFPWMGVNFFLKDGLRMDASTLQILQNSANLPMVAKPFYGLLSDSFYIFGQHRIPYIAFGAFLQAVSWLSIAFLSPSNISFFTITVYLLLGNLGASVVEVANDAMVAASYAIIPALTGTMFYYQTQHLKIESSILGISKVFGQAAMLLWGVMYNRHLKTVQPRKLISEIQATIAVLMISDVLFVKGLYRKMGVED